MPTVRTLYPRYVHYTHGTYNNPTTPAEELKRKQRFRHRRALPGEEGNDKAGKPLFGESTRRHEAREFQRMAEEAANAAAQEAAEVAKRDAQRIEEERRMARAEKTIAELTAEAAKRQVTIANAYVVTAGSPSCARRMQ